MEANFSPDFDATNSLSINRPMGCEYLRPFGAVNCMVISDMVKAEGWKCRRGMKERGREGKNAGRRRDLEREGPRKQRGRRGEAESIYNYDVVYGNGK